MPAPTHRPGEPRRDAGFTLVELLIAVAIVLVLAGAALPSYTQFIQESRRQDARQLLQVNAHRLQRCFTLEGVYDGSCHLRTASEREHYRLDATLGTSSYTLRAVPTPGGRQASDAACAAFTYTHTGAKGATGSDPESCW